MNFNSNIAYIQCQTQLNKYLFIRQVYNSVCEKPAAYAEGNIIGHQYLQICNTELHLCVYSLVALLSYGILLLSNKSV